MSSPTLRILRRSLRLPQLKQGGTLSIYASGLVATADAENTPAAAAAAANYRPSIPPLTVRIVPGWRDDAEVELWQQIYVDDERAAAAAAASKQNDIEGGVSNKHITDDLVVGLSARISDENDHGDGLFATDSAAPNALGKRSGDVSLRLDLEAAFRSSPTDNNLAEEIDVHDMEIQVELDDDDDDIDDGIMEEYGGSNGDGDRDAKTDSDSDSDNPNNNNNSNSSSDANADQNCGIDDLFECSDDHGLNSLTLVANVPEKVNLRCHLEGAGNIVVEGKLEGQHGFDLRAARGNIKVKKLRGDSVRLVAGYCAEGSAKNSEEGRPTGIVYATDLVEAQTVSIEAGGRMRAKMVNGTDINLSICDSETSTTTTTTRPTTPPLSQPLEVDDTGALIDIGSLYTTKNGNGANVEVIGSANGRSVASKVGSPELPRAVRIKSSHGHVSVTATVCESAIENNVDEFDQKIPIVELGGVNGSCDVLVSSDAAEAKASSQSSLLDAEDECVSARVHVDSLTPDSVSFVSAAYGHVELTVDRKVEADLRLVSSPNVSDIDADALLVDDEDGVRKECDRLDSLTDDPTSVVPSADSNRMNVQTNSFSQNQSAVLPNGTEYVEGTVHNRSFEPDSRFDVKTKHSSAAGAADINKGVGKVNIMGAAAQALAGFSGKKGGEQSPLFAVASSRSIKVETVSWFGAIARRYGMEDRRKDVGRTANREGRLK